MHIEFHADHLIVTRQSGPHIDSGELLKRKIVRALRINPAWSRATISDIMRDSLYFVTDDGTGLSAVNRGPSLRDHVVAYNDGFPIRLSIY